MFHNTLKTTLPIVMIALTLLAAPAGASPTIYPTRTDWTAAVTNIITAPFNAQAGATAYTGYNTPAGLTVGEVNFVGFTGTPGEYNLKVYNPAYDPTPGTGIGPLSGWRLVAQLPVGHPAGRWRIRSGR